MRGIISGDFEEDTATSSGCVLGCSALVLSLPLPRLPVSYGGLRTQKTWIPPPFLLWCLLSAAQGEREHQRDGLHLPPPLTWPLIHLPDSSPPTPVFNPGLITWPRCLLVSYCESWQGLCLGLLLFGWTPCVEPSSVQSVSPVSAPLVPSLSVKRLNWE